MITEKEIQAVDLSPTKKDFYQIWNELLDTASKISERWDPLSSNESDPGIVLLKVLAALGDKLNYNIDKNTLEAFMPSATQQESMRKLCDMMGYSMKYFGSATTTATIKYLGENWPGKSEDNTQGSWSIIIPKYSTLTDQDNKISYVTLDQVTFTYELDEGISSKFTVDSVPCIEGQLCVCENNGNTNQLITISQLDDNYRYYLPETQVAENGIFIFDGTVTSTGLRLNDEEWKRVDNLNVQKLDTRCFKVCFDSKKNIPYIQFPQDVSALIGDGLRIMYIRTNGINGNISANTLTVLNEPDEWKADVDNAYSDISIDDFVVTNPSAATNGYNPESIESAYNNYKKTIGTFDTLVTCRDYMNKIYQLTEDDIDTTPLVSNIIVSDIRDDINRSFTLCEFNDYGIKYKDKVLTDSATKEPLINHFDIVLYPFRSIYSGSSEENYLKSFTYSLENSTKIEDDIEYYKTISHSIKYPINTDIVCIKNYLKLNAKITTVYKVNAVEESSILNAIYNAIYTTFNMRKLDFGESIPFDDILKCIENADSRIKNVALDEPLLYTVFVTADNNEYGITSSAGTELGTAKGLYNKLAIRNILAGKIALFNYNEDFMCEYSEKPYSNATIEPFYPDPSSELKLIELTPSFTLATNSFNLTSPYTLDENEVIQFRAPNFRTNTTYPAYVNYYLHLENGSGTNAISAMFRTLGEFLSDIVTTTPITKDRWDYIFDLAKSYISEETGVVSSEFSARLTACGALWKKTTENNIDKYTRVKVTSDLPNPTGTNTLYAIKVTESTYPIIYTYVTDNSLGHSLGNYSGIYTKKWNADNVPGNLVDANGNKYIKCRSYVSMANELSSMYVQVPYEITTGTWVDGLGVNANVESISKDENYLLKDRDYLLINYTESSDSADTSGEKIVKNVIYTKGTIIRPNFELKDSYKNNTYGQVKFTKTSGFSFIGYNIDGMYSLGSSEQIEIRDKATLTLGKSVDKNNIASWSNVYIYWNILGEENEEGSTIAFPWENNSYTLKPGEYFYFTDDSKLDMSFYGAGTEIKRTGTINIDKAKKLSSNKSTDEILSAGINGIDWWKISPNDTNHIDFIEYQYINLVKDDQIIDIDFNETTLDYTFKDCDGAKYKFNGSSETSLPKLNVGDNDSWQVRSLLQLDIGPKQTQTLHKNDSLTLKYDDLTTTEIKPNEINNQLVPLSIKTNYVCQSAEGAVDVRVKVENTSSDSIIWLNDFKLKTFERNDNLVDTKDGTKETLPTHNFGKYWTKVTMSDLITNTESSNGHIDLNITLPSDDNTYGLVMLYSIAASEEKTEQPYIKVGSGSYIPKIFNYGEDNFTWWEDYMVGNKYYLKPGINVLYVNESTVLNIYPDIVKDEENGIDMNASGNATIVIGDLDIVNKSNTNPYGIAIDSLEYQYTGEGEATIQNRAETLLADINAYDVNHEFYYNCRIENSDLIDINTATSYGTSAPIETLATPSVWYDYNNINNKFVISEIDSAYMRKYGISIAKSSKR